MARKSDDGGAPTCPKSHPGLTVARPTKIEDELWSATALPSNELDNVMWGDAGVPSAAEADTEEEKTTKQSTCVQDGNAVDQSAASTREDQVVDPKIRLTCVAWKLRSGFGKFSVGHAWERRRFVLTGSKILYYEFSEDKDPLPDDEMKSESVGVEATVPSWLEESVANLGRETNHTKPRGILDLSQEDVIVEAREGHFGSPTEFEIRIKVKGETKWEFCFESQSVQIEWLAALKEVTGSSSQDPCDEKWHGFEPGDHIIRWEMLPIVYPIQVHGIVLEAGRNCVIIADFGLTSYGKISTDNKESHDSVMAAWKKLKPKEKKRLNVVALTDPKEIRQWSKINYGGALFSKKGHGISSWFRKSSKSADTDKDDTSETTSACVDDNTEENGKHSVSQSERDGSTVDEQNGSASGGPSGRKEEDSPDCDFLHDPDWFYDNEQSCAASSISRPAVFSLADDENGKSEKPHGKPQKLPKSDPTKIVLARANFILEHGEDILPPYHVFHSNSECIAVWCKTGRWSTLQAAVFLTSTSLGTAKSATVLTIGVAAAHMILVPALAVGGLAVVTAPWLVLKKSKGKWEKATRLLTDQFWSYAEPEVFVEAIEHWSGLHLEC